MDRAEVILSSISSDKGLVNSENRDDNQSALIGEISSKIKTNSHTDFDSNKDASILWKKSCDILNETLDSQIFLAWIKPLKALSFTLLPRAESNGSYFGRLTLGAPNKFCCNHVLNEYKTEILDAASEVSGVLVNELDFEIAVSYTHLTLPTNREV